MYHSMALGLENDRDHVLEYLTDVHGGFYTWEGSNCQNHPNQHPVVFYRSNIAQIKALDIVRSNKLFLVMLIWVT